MFSPSFLPALFRFLSIAAVDIGQLSWTAASAISPQMETEKKEKKS